MLFLFLRPLILFSPAFPSSSQSDRLEEKGIRGSQLVTQTRAGLTTASWSHFWLPPFKGEEKGASQNIHSPSVLCYGESHQLSSGTTDWLPSKTSLHLHNPPSCKHGNSCASLVNNLPDGIAFLNSSQVDIAYFPCVS